jgi:general secretion pathway protein D
MTIRKCRQVFIVLFFAAVLPVVSQAQLSEEIRSDVNMAVAEKTSVEKEADASFVKGRDLFERSEYQQAVDEYIKAKKKLETITGAHIQPKITRINQAIAEAYYFWAEEIAGKAEKAANMSDYDEAIKLCYEGIKVSPSSETRMKDLIGRYTKMKQVVEFRTKTSENYADPRADERAYSIDVLYEQGKRLYNDGQYDKARDKFEEILAINPYHLKAAEQIKIIYVKMYAAGEERHLATERERMAEAEWKYIPPLIPRTYTTTTEILKEPVLKNEETSSIQKKLNDIKIDKIEFDEVSVQTAVKYLKTRSRELDPDGKGVNILLRLSSGEAPAAAPAAAEPADGAEPPVPTPAASSAMPTITMLVDNIPLGEAIRYICRGANLKYRIEKYAVVIAAQEIPLDDLETRIYPLEQEAISEIGGEAGAGGAEAGTDTTSSSGAVQEYFRNRGISFPEGARIVFDSRISRLIATNTPDNLSKLEDLIQELNVVDPQVLIEAKFVELQEEDVDSLGIEWLIQRPNTLSNPPLGASSMSFNQNDPLMRFSDDLATTWTGNNDVLLNVTRHSAEGATYQALLHALNASQKTEILSTPRVTTMNGQEATIRMTTEQFFPESWGEAEIISNSSTGRTYIVPSLPEFGDPTELGVRLTVTPTVDADKYTIALAMIPVIQTHIGWIDYSYNITYAIGGTITNTLIMPIIETRTVETQLTVYDGETIVMGGTIRDTSTVTDDRVPAMGDLPLIGRLFRSKTEERDKRNLLIFVSVRLVSPDGSPIREREIRGLPPFRR